MPWRRAAALTGDGISSWRRPWGRSGWVTTSWTSWPAARSRSRVGTANAGVPRKTTFNWSLPLPRLLQLLDLALDQIALESAEVAEKQDAVEVIDLMLHGAGEEVFAGD